ncbi:MAG TPA: hypothetical protein VNT53_06505 [Pseudolysinimonas sp.]|nr:hypothetical protein [Pseudolysinimonas sp.]
MISLRSGIFKKCSICHTTDSKRGERVSLRGKTTTDELRDILQDAHISFLIGAGTSSGVFDVLGDLETALTELAATKTADPTQARTVRAALYAKFFDGVVVKNNLILDRDPSTQQLFADHRQFVRTINELLVRRRSSILNKQVNLFTTNIDLLLELTLDDLGIDLNDGFTGRFKLHFDTSNFGALRYRRSLQYENLSEVPTFNLLKLHGSAAWDSSDDSKNIYFDPTLKQVAKVAEVLNAARVELEPLAVTDPIDLNGLLAASQEITNTGHIDAFVNEYEKLAIINPTKEKFQTTVLNDNYYDLLRVLSNELEKENSVLMAMGFSFRDEHIKHLIVRAARSNPTLRVIVFCYDDAALAKVESEIDEALVRNSNIVLVGPTSSDDEAKLTLSRITEQYLAPVLGKKSRVDEDAEDEGSSADEPE